MIYFCLDDQNSSFDSPKSELESVRANQRQQSISFEGNNREEKTSLRSRHKEEYGREENLREMKSVSRSEDLPTKT